MNIWSLGYNLQSREKELQHYLSLFDEVPEAKMTQFNGSIVIDSENPNILENQNRSQKFTFIR